MKSPDISILSDEFLAEVQGMEKKNLATEALRKLLNGEIRSHGKSNVVQTRAFSQRLEDAIARYHNNAITTAQVIQELIDLAKDIRAARQRGEEDGLSPDEVAFYDALADNESAVEVMGDEQVARHCPRAADQPEADRQHRLGGARLGPCPHAGAGQAHPAQVRLSAGPTGRRGADGVAAGGGVVGAVGGLRRS